MNAVFHRDLAILDELEPEWRVLWDADPVATPFNAPEFLRPWWAERPVGSPLIVELRDGRTLSGLAFMILHEGVLRFAGDPDLTDYHAPLARASDRDAVARALLDASPQSWERAELHELASDGPWVESIARAAKAAGLDVAETTGEACPRVSVTGEYEVYLAGLPQKLRHEIRRKARRLERDGGTYAVRLSDEASLDADLRRFYDMHRRSDGAKGHFLDDGIASFFTALARGFLARGGLRLSWLDLAGEPVAGILSFAVRDTWYIYNSVFDHTQRDLGPGMVLMGETIRLAADEGARVFDLLRGDEPYKYRFGAVDVPLTHLDMSRPT